MFSIYWFQCTRHSFWLWHSRLVIWSDSTITTTKIMPSSILKFTDLMLFEFDNMHLWSSNHQVLIKLPFFFLFIIIIKVVLALITRNRLFLLFLHYWLRMLNSFIAFSLLCLVSIHCLCYLILYILLVTIKEHHLFNLYWFRTMLRCWFCCLWSSHCLYLLMGIII